MGNQYASALNPERGSLSIEGNRPPDVLPVNEGEQADSTIRQENPGWVPNTSSARLAEIRRFENPAEFSYRWDQRFTSTLASFS